MKKAALRFKTGGGFFNVLMHVTAQPIYNRVVIFALVGENTGAAILDSVWLKNKVSAAFVAQRIQRAKAEQAIKVFPVRLMAGKIFAGGVAEIRIAGADRINFTGHVGASVWIKLMGAAGFQKIM